MGSDKSIKRARRDATDASRTLLRAMAVLDYYERRRTFKCPECDSQYWHKQTCGIAKALMQYRGEVADELKKFRDTVEPV